MGTSIFLTFDERIKPNRLSHQNGHVGSQKKMTLDLYDACVLLSL